MPISSDALAVVMGIIFGVAASIPTSLLIVASTKSRRNEYAGYRQQAPMAQPDQPEPIDVEFRPVDSWGVEVVEFQPQGKPRIIGGYPE